MRIFEITKVTLHDKDDWYGADVRDLKNTKPDPIINVQVSKLTTYEPADKTAAHSASTESEKNVRNLMRAIRTGKEIPPIIVRRFEGYYQVVDGHHRLEAYKRLGVQSIKAKLVSKFNVDEGWKGTLAGIALGAASVVGANKLTTQEPVPAPHNVAPISQSAPIRLPESARPLVTAAQAAGIDGIELSQFLAQCSHESLNFARMEEMGTDEYLTKKYDKEFRPSKAKLLGNVKPGDGIKYKGRGFIQLTGRYNYKKAGEALGLPLEKHPELVATPDVAAKVAVWFWQSRVSPKVSDFSDTAKSTKPINAKLNGLADRDKKFKEYTAMAAPRIREI